MSFTVFDIAIVLYGVVWLSYSVFQRVLKVIYELKTALDSLNLILENK